MSFTLQLDHWSDGSWWLPEEEEIQEKASALARRVESFNFPGTGAYLRCPSLPLVCFMQCGVMTAQ